MGTAVVGTVAGIVFCMMERGWISDLKRRDEVRLRCPGEG